MGLWDLIIKMGMDTTGVMLAEKKVDSAMSALGKKIGNYMKGAFTFYAIEESLRKTIMLADELVDKAEQYGTTVENIQKAQNAARNYGLPEDKLLDMTNKYAELQNKAAQGDVEALKAMSRLHLTMIDVKDETIDWVKALNEAFQIISSMPQTGALKSDVNKNFGRNAAKFAPAIAGMNESGSILDMSEGDARLWGQAGDFIAAAFAKGIPKYITTIPHALNALMSPVQWMKNMLKPHDIDFSKEGKALPMLGTPKSRLEDIQRVIDTDKLINESEKERLRLEAKKLPKMKVARELSETMFDSLNQIGGFAQQSRGMSGVQSESVRLLGAIKDATESIAREGL